MRQTRTSTFFECKVQSVKTLENGQQKRVTEQYVVDAFSFAEAENTLIEEVTPYIDGDFAVVAEKIAPYKEISLSENDADDKFYLAKVNFITLDEKSGKEKKQKVCYLIQASDSDTALKYTNELFDGSMVDYEISAIAETPTLDIFLHKND